MELLDAKTIRENDHLINRTDRETLLNVIETNELRFLPEVEVGIRRLEEPIKGQKLIEVVVPDGSFLEESSLEEVNLLDRYDSTVLAVRRGGELTHTGMNRLEINAGDVLLVLSTERTLERLRNNQNFVIAQEMEASGYRRSKRFTALGLLAGVVLAAVFGLIPIVVAALAGVVGMVVTGCVRPNEIYESVDWEVIFLLAGLIPLGKALQKTGTSK